MRMAFDKAVKDPDYLADLIKAKLDGDTMSGQATADAYKSIVGTPKSVVDRAAVALVAPK